MTKFSYKVSSTIVYYQSLLWHDSKYVMHDPLKNELIDNDLFDFTPSIEGKMIWIDDQTVEFRPNQILKGNQDFAVEFNLGKVLEVPSEFRSFEFAFRTIPQALDLEITSLTIPDKNSPSIYQLDGIINTADVTDNALLEKCLVAALNQNDL